MFEGHEEFFSHFFRICYEKLAKIHNQSSKDETYIPYDVIISNRMCLFFFSGDEVKNFDRPFFLEPNSGNSWPFFGA